VHGIKLNEKTKWKTLASADIQGGQESKTEYEHNDSIKMKARRSRRMLGHT